MKKSRLIRRTALAVTTALIGGAHIGASVALADPAPADANYAAAGLRTFTQSMGGLGSLETFSSPLPLTRRTTRELLRLDTIFVDTLGASVSALATGGGGTAGQLQTAISNADLAAGADGIAVDYSGVTVSDATPGILDVGFTVTVTATRNLPIDYLKTRLTSEGEEELVFALTGSAGAAGQRLPVTVSMTGAFDFSFDAGTTLPALLPFAFRLDAPPTLTVNASASNATVDVDAVYGVTDVDVTGSAAYAYRTQVGPFTDPDGVGGITQAEWTTSLPEDLLAPVALLDGTGNDLDVNLSLDSTLISGTGDGSLTWSTANRAATAPPAEPTLATGSELGNFANVGADDMLAGLGQFTTALQAAEAEGDVPLPFLDAHLGDGYSPATKLLEYVRRQSDAVVVCGKTDTNPPGEQTLPGDTWYCQAYAAHDAKAGSVTWTIAAGQGTAGANVTDIATVGVGPTKNAVFTGVVGEPDVTVTFQDPDTTDEGATVAGAIHTVERRFRTATELQDGLQRTLFGATVPTGQGVTLDYEESTDALTFAILQNTDPAAVTTALSFGDVLRADAHLVGPEPATATDGAVTVDLGTVALDLALGVSLKADLVPLEPANGTDGNDEATDRFFAVIDSAGPEMQIADLTVTPKAGFVLNATIGYLGVTATSTSFAVTRDNASNPLLTVQIAADPATGAGANGTGVANSVLLSHLIDSVDTVVTATTNLQFTGGLSVVPSGNLSGLVTGARTVALSWDPVTVLGSPTVTPSATYVTDLVPYDLSPEVRGFVTGTTSSSTLTDADANFLSAFGFTVAANTELDLTIYNRTTGATCTGLKLLSNTTLQCIGDADTTRGIAGLTGGVQRGLDGVPALGTDGATLSDNDWSEADLYEVRGNALALGTLVVEAFVDLANQLDNHEGDGFRMPLPLIGRSPRDFVPQFGRVRTAMVELKEALEAPGTGDPDTHAITGGPPASLQELETAIESELGLAAGGLQISLQSLTTPAAGGAAKPHLVLQLGSIGASGTENLDATAGSDLSLQLPLGPSELVLAGGEDQDPDLPTTWTSSIKLDLGIPLDPGLDPNNVLVLGTTGVTDLTVNTEGTAVDLTGSYSAMDLKIGTNAFKTGTHKSRTGTHTADPYTTGTASETKVTGADNRTSATAASTTMLTDTTKDFVALGVEPGFVLTNTTDNGTCTVAALTATTMTCGSALTAGDWSTGNAYSYTWQSATKLTTGSTTGTTANMIVENTTDNAWCTVTAVTGTTITCSGGLNNSGKWTSGDAFRVTSPRILQDSATDFTAAGVTTGSVVTNTTDNATCTVSTVATNSLTCSAALAKVSGTGLASWHKADAWTLNVPSRLYDPGAKFDTFNIGVGTDVIRNTTKSTQCTITAVTADTISCAAGTITWDPTDAYKLGAVDDAKLGVDYDLLAPGAALLDPPDPTTGFMASLVGTPRNATTPKACGNSQSGDMCARLSVQSNDTAAAYLGVVEIKLDFGGTPTAVRPSALTLAQQGGEPLDFTLLDTSLSFLPSLATDYLDGRTTGTSVGLVGEDLDAGAEVPDSLATLVDGLNGFGSTVGAPANAGALKTAIEDKVETGIATSAGDGIARLGEATADVRCGASPCAASAGIGTVSDIHVTVLVGGNLATGVTAPTKGCVGTSATTCGTATHDVPFDFGVPGLQVTSDANLTSTAGWSLLLDFGLNRDDGPYLGTSSTDELRVGARVQLPDTDNSASCSVAKPADPADAKAPSAGTESLVSKPSQFSSTRCFDAKLGLLEATVFDGNTTPAADADTWTGTSMHDRTRADLLTKVNFAPATGGPTGKLTLDALLLDEDGSGVTVDADSNLDVYFKTKDPTSSRPLPVLFGSLHMLYDSGNTPKVEQLEYRDVMMDLSPFYSGFLGPLLKDIKEKVKPIAPFIDNLTAPIPVVSDISEKTGNGAVTLYDLLEIMIARKRAKATTVKEEKKADMIRTFLTLMKTIDGMSGMQAPSPGIMGLGEVYTGSAPADAGVRGTGGFKVDTQGMTGTCGSTDDGKRLPKDCQRTTTRKVLGATSGRVFGQSGNDVSKTETIKQLQDCPSSGCTGKELAKTVTKQTTTGLTGTGLPTFPFLTDAKEVYGMLMGSHATLVHQDFGVLNATGAMSISFGPFMAGPVPIDVTIGLAVTVDARLVMGYDTKGLSSFGGDALDGIYIDDLDKSGKDVPEVRFLTTVTLGAAVSVKVFRVGLEGGVTLSILLDLQDPDHDGKLRLQEIASFGRDPWCMFNARGTLEFFLRFFVEIDLTFWSKKWTWEPWRLKPPLELFNVSCDPPAPVLATASGVNLLLNIGDRASTRAFESDQVDEEFTVRQLETQPAPSTTRTTTRVTVTAFGIQQDYTVGIAGRILVNNASTGDDVVMLQSGADSAGVEIPFTIPATISMGTGNDRIEAGGGADILRGGPDDDGDGANDRDVIKAGPGNDTLNGGDGKDVLDGGLGDDTINGGDMDDRVTGGAGGDVVRAGAGDDDVSGGPGLNATVAAVAATKRFPTDTAARTALTESLQDKADLLIGDAGSDELKGLFGDDRLFGDSPTATYASAAAVVTDTECAATGGTTPGNGDRVDGEGGSDHIFGGPGHDQLSGGRDGDTMCGNDGDDVLDGDVEAPGAPGYNDVLRGGRGDDALFGRAGDDTLEGGNDHDLLMAGDGDDRMQGGLGADALDGGVGKDIGLGDTGTIPSASVIGTTGNTVTGIVVDAIADTGTVQCASAVSLFNGLFDVNGDGSVTTADDGHLAGFHIVDGKVDLDRSGAVDISDNGAVLDLLVAAGTIDLNGDGSVTASDDGLLQATVVRPSAVASGQSNNADCIDGGVGADALYGGGAADRVNGGDGADLVAGGSGNDELRGAQMDDEVRGDAGNDAVFGDSGNDAMFGGDGNDTMHGGLGNDRIEGNGADDTIHGDAQDDSVIGGSSTAGAADGADTLEGNIGSDVVVGDNSTITGTGAARVVAQLDLPTTTDAGSDTRYGNDLIRGGPDADRLYGGGGNDTVQGDDVAGVTGDDYLEGNHGRDVLEGGPGHDNLIGGSSTAGVLDGNVGAAGDTIRGGLGNDVVLGDNGTIDASRVPTRLQDATTDDAADDATSGDDSVFGDAGVDVVHGQGGNDTISGGDEADRIQGNAGADTINGNNGDDDIVGGSDTAGIVDHNVGGAGDTVHGDDGNDIVLGDNGTVTGTARVVTRLDDATTDDGQDDTESGDDSLFGDAGADVVEGQGGNDTISGGADADRIQGNAGRDTVAGDAGDDDIAGGSDTAGIVDENVGGSGDTIDGNGGADVIIGDNGTISGSGRTVARFDDATTGDSQDDSFSGDDTIRGGTEADVIQAQGGDDLVGGGDHDDRIQGNAGKDTIDGNGGADDIAGGSDTAGIVDENVGGAGDTVHGDDGNDVVIGDNGTITGTGRTVTRHNDSVTDDTADDLTSGDDTLFGDLGADVVEGQGGNDTIAGGDDADDIQGNAGADTIAGDAGDDDIAGGSNTAGIVDESIGGVGDTIQGNAGEDVVLGDNGTISGSGAARVWRFFDLYASGQTPNAYLSGKDTIDGNDGVDRLFGQGDDDRIDGGGDDDRIQGNAGADTVTGDAGADDIVGGSASHTVGGTLTKLPHTLDGDDVVSGSNGDGTATGDAGDVILGDNGLVTRPGGTDPNTGDATRDVELFDMGFTGLTAKPTDISGADTITGWAGRDTLAGQAEGDTLYGNDGDDYLEGNDGTDRLEGHAGDDDLIGGSSEKGNGLLGQGGFPTATGARDGNDTVFGGIGHDAVAGDNAAIVRKVSGGGTWLRYGAPWSDLLQRDVLVPSTAEAAGAYGADIIDAGVGHDEVHGELGGDTIDTREGDDTVVGDLGKVTTVVVGGPGRTISADGPFVSETVDVPGSLRRTVQLFVPDTAFDDVVTAGLGNDVVHGGGGNDRVDGHGDVKNDTTHSALDALATACAADVRACDKDAVFGGHGDDTLWGGPDRDHVFGGTGADKLDVVTAAQGDPTVDFKGADILYGGWGSDAMQADMSQPSPNGVDKLIDAAGVYNAYYICESAYGGNSVMRQVSPGMIAFLQDLAQADGALTPKTKNSSGYLELSIVFSNEVSKNSNPAISPVTGRCDAA